MASYDGVFVRIKIGTYRNPPHDRKVEDKVFRLAKPFYTGVDRRTKVNVYGTVEDGLEDRVCRIFCNLEDIEYIDKDGNPVKLRATADEEAGEDDGAEPDVEGVNFEKLFHSSETDEEAMERIRHTFVMFDRIVESVCDGVIRGLIVSGPPGIGKSFGVESILNKNNLFNKVKAANPMFDIVKGYASPINIYKTLFNHAAPGHVVVFDDCDDALEDDTALNILKAALDSGDKRVISWLAESRVLKNEDIPSQFDFKGNVIFLTNKDFERTTSPRMKAHMDAMLSRCHYLDLDIGCQRDQLLRIRQIVNDGMLKPYELDPHKELEVVDYVFRNADHMRELSLRMVKKLADLRKAYNDDMWLSFAERTCLKRGAKYERLYKQQLEKRKAECV